MPHIHRFGRFELRTQERLLLHDGEPRPLGARAIATVAPLGCRFALPCEGRAGAAAPNNLPAERTRFIGREAALDDAAQRLGQARLLSLTGIGGSGKTRLAQAPGSSTPELLRTRVHGSTMLVVLDNCEHLLDAVAELATSREALGLAGESVLPVRPLALPPADAALAAVARAEAVRLFSERAVLRWSSCTKAARPRPCARHCGHFLALAEAEACHLMQAAQLGLVIQHLDTERDNLLQALARCRQAGDSRSELRLIGALATVARQAGRIEEAWQRCLDLTQALAPGA